MWRAGVELLGDRGMRGGGGGSSVARTLGSANLCASGRALEILIGLGVAIKACRHDRQVRGSEGLRYEV